MSGASSRPGRAAGLRRLDGFVNEAGTRYTKLRNFDFGPERRGNVSMLSPYTRYRLVLEQEILEAVLQRHTLAAASKFVQEVFWRGYFKGWLEHHPDIWADYRAAVAALLEQMESDADLRERYNTAVHGNTRIECFDTWVNELVTHGYLHNHTRMWFASIWVYTLNLPWQLGADFFYRHLLDGDPASNTLSWRWVCGLHTRGKTYLARASNIASYTDDRFSPVGQLAGNAPPLSESRVFPARPLPPSQELKQGEPFGLLITEEDACPLSLFDGRKPVNVLGISATRMRSPLPVGTPAYEFAHAAVADAVDRTTRAAGVKGEVTEAIDWADLLVEWARNNDLSTIATAYAPVGPVAELLSDADAALERHGIRLVQLRRAYDNVTWPHSRRGFFKLREKIPTILERLEIPGVAGEGRSEAS
jgi:deoxyribodipyrimidine photo-lyase